MQIRQRKILLTGLLAAWALQTVLVYVDDTAAQQAPLSPLALEGRQIWHDYNCQACHQVYGFGGFLGPDLTNAAPRLTRDRLDTVLTEGSLQMPAFRFSPEKIDAIGAYLVALDKTGVGQARRKKPLVNSLVEVVIESMLKEEHPMSAAALSGRQIFFKGTCIACHTLCRTVSMGMIAAPDLVSATGRLSDAAIEATLVDGRPARGMPPSALSPEQRTDVVAFLHWLSDHRVELLSLIGDDKGSSGVPWFEFK